jgi:uncharacterized repeat protein (TIGR01451 family)
MKKILNVRLLIALLVAAVAPASWATVFFTDNFSNGSTTNLVSNPGGTPTQSFTSYDIASQKNTIPNTNPPTNGVVIYPGGLNMRLQSPTTSGWHEAQALFTTNPVTLTAAGDYIDLQIVFTNTALFPTNTQGTLLIGTSSFIALGLYNSGAQVGVSNPPVAGALAQSGLSTASGSIYAAGNCANWFGYVAQVASNGSSRIVTRSVQNGAGTTSANQDLIALGAGSGAWNNPSGTAVTPTVASPVILASNGTYTLELNIYLSAVNGSTNVLAMTNTLYSGVGTGGSVVFQLGTNNTTAIATSFDGLSFGAAARGGALAIDPCMDVSSIQVTGFASPPVLPTITLQPAAVQVANGGSCAFFVAATGSGLTYQWKRHGTNLLNQGNISGVTSTMLVITNAGAQDALTTLTGYSCLVTGAGNLSTNSFTNSLTLISATTLYYGAGTWDVETSSSWNTTDDTGSEVPFDFGDPVNFTDNGGGNVTLSGNYLSAASVTVSQTSGFLTWAGSGSFAGPGNLVYNGSAQFTVNNVNTFSGGTLISSATANVRLGNPNGLGTGPITFGLAGGKMEILPVGATVPNDMNVQDDFTIVMDATNTSTGVILNGNLSGTTGKTLTLAHSPTIGIGTNVTRIRVAGESTVYNANLVLGTIVSGDTNFVWSPSAATGVQVYNGVISGLGGFLQKSSTAILNNQNTYSGNTIPAAGAIGFGVDSVGSPTITSGPIGTSALLLMNDSTTTFNSTASVFASGGAHTVANPIQYRSGTNNLMLILGGTNDLTLSGAFSLQGNDGGGAGGTNRTIQVTNMASSTLSGVISDGGLVIGLIKSGQSPLYVNNNNTYSGLTTVNSGLAINTNGLGLLAGTGTIAGSVLVQTNSAIGGGSATTIGTLNISGNLTNNGNVFARLNKSLSPFQSNDVVSVTGALTNTGTGKIIVTNIGPAIAIGDKFFLLNKPMANSASLGVIGGGISWNNNLAVDGSIVAVAPADVSTLLAGPASIPQGGSASYTLTFSNSGPGIATGVVATDTLLSTNVTFVSASNGGVTNATSNMRLVTWGAIALDPNTSTNFTVTVSGGSLGSVTNVATFTSVSFDTNPANNSATNITSVVAAQADLGVLIAGPASVTSGATTNYTLTVSNAGPNTATGILVTDTIPTSVTFVSASNGGSANAGKVVWSGFALAANTATNFTLTVNAVTIGNATNTANVTSTATDPNLANNSATNVMAITSSSIIPTIPAHISSFSIAGANVVIGGTNGVNGGTYYLLDSTDVAKPFGQWLSAATNVVSASGGSASFTFTGTNAVTPNGTQQYYILSNTNNH